MLGTQTADSVQREAYAESAMCGQVWHCCDTNSEQQHSIERKRYSVLNVKERTLAEWITETELKKYNFGD